MRKLLGTCIAFTMLLAGYAHAQTPPNVNVQGIWRNDPDESEPGWGLNLAHQGDILFASWFTYDTDGTSMWLYMSSAQKTGTNRYEGDIYRSTGAPYNDYSAASFDQAIACIHVDAGFTIRKGRLDFDHGNIVRNIESLRLAG